MLPAATSSSASFSDIPVLCIPVICRQLGKSGSRPIVRIRTVNYDFYTESRIPLAESIHEELKAINHHSVPEPAARLGRFRHFLNAVKNKDYLPERLRLPILRQLSRIVITLANKEFHSAWRDMVDQFNSESEEVRSQLQADMDKNAGKCELYGDGGVAFTFKTPAW
jgi:hypothetical protein